MSTPATSSHTVVSAALAPGTSALVLEFLCLFTHDLRRKQKRWQDGRLKYHTFNRRVMAYDDRGNFIGDMHWRSDRALDAGEEIQLERGGVIVQVSDCVGQQTQDLSELVDKRVQERERRIREKAQRGTTTPSSRPSLTVHPGSHAPHTHHRSLNALVGTPTGHHGRALVPSDSPFEQRRRTDDIATEGDVSRSIKRRKYDDTPPSKLGYAQSLFGTALTLSGAPPSSARLTAQPVTPNAQLTAPAPQARPPSTPELRAPVALAPGRPYQHDDAAPRGPLQAIDDRRTNSIAESTRRPVAKMGLGIPSDPRRSGAIHSDSNAKQRRESKSPARARPNSTPSAEDRERSAPTAMRRNTSRPHQHYGQSRSERGIDVDKSSDKSPAQHETGASAETTRRTELRLKSRRKRGLLVVSEQATNKLGTEMVERSLATKSVVSVCPTSHGETVQRSVHESLLGPQPIPRTGDLSSSTSAVRPDPLRAQDSYKRKEDEGRPYQPGNHADGAQKTPGDEEGRTTSEVHSPAGKSGKETQGREGVGGDGTELRDDGAGEAQGKSSAQRRTNRRSAQRSGTATVAQGEDGSVGRDTAAGSTRAAQTAPRLVKLSRKSVRSKELLGFDFNAAESGSGNDGFPVNVLDRAPVEISDSPSNPPRPIEADIPHPYPADGKTKEPARLFDSSPTTPTLRTDWKSERAQVCTRKAPSEAHGVDTTDCEDTRKEDAAQPCAHVGPTTDPSELLDRNVVARDTPRDLSRTHEAALGATTGENGVELAPAPKEVRKLANPATRGRKAALRSHAAGLAPQPVLPADVGVLPAQVPQRERNYPRGMGTGTTRSEPSKIRMTFPGFVSAKGGGPWSREADDLLESGRPN